MILNLSNSVCFCLKTISIDEITYLFEICFHTSSKLMNNFSHSYKLFRLEIDCARIICIFVEMAFHDGRFAHGICNTNPFLRKAQKSQNKFQSGLCR